MRTFEYDTDLYPFRQIVSEWFDVDNISKLHEIKKYNLFDREHDQSSKWHKVFYEKIREDNSFNESIKSSRDWSQYKQYWEGYKLSIQTQHFYENLKFQNSQNLKKFKKIIFT